MNWKEIKIAYREYASVDELPENWKELVQRAREAAKNAYAPYSNFHVGAALQLAGGRNVTENKQETAAYPVGLFAELTALFHANANYLEEAVDVIAVTATNSNGRVGDPVKPCGGCRQALLEVENRYNKPITIILDGSNAIYVLDGVDSLLPLNFRPEALTS